MRRRAAKSDGFHAAEERHCQPSMSTSPRSPIRQVDRRHQTGCPAEGRPSRSEPTLGPAPRQHGLHAVGDSNPGRPTQLHRRRKGKFDNLRELIDTFASKGAVATVPRRSAAQTGATTRLNYSPTQVELADIAAQLIPPKSPGGVIVAFAGRGARKAHGLRRRPFGRQVERRRLLSAAAAKPAMATTAASGGAGKAKDNPLKVLAPVDLDANVELKAGSLTLNQQQINGLHVLVGLKDGTLDIRDLSVKGPDGRQGARSPARR